MKNKDLKDAFRVAGIRQWEVAEAMGVSEMTLVKWMRVELSEERRQRILTALEQLTQSRTE